MPPSRRRVLDTFCCYAALGVEELIFTHTRVPIIDLRGPSFAPCISMILRVQREALEPFQRSRLQCVYVRLPTFTLGHIG